MGFVFWFMLDVEVFVVDCIWLGDVEFCVECVVIFDGVGFVFLFG